MRIIAGRWRGHTIQAPGGSAVRPTADRVREAWMSMMGPELAGSRVLDLFSGSGALGLEALSRGAGEVVFVERAKSSLNVLRENIERLGPESGEVKVVRGEVFSYLQGVEAGSFDLALADPPYGREIATRLLEYFTARPFADVLWVEHGTGETLPEIADLRSRAYGDTTLTRLAAEH